jgi:hypothetical protein
MADIFISYAQRDREIAKQLANSLTVRGYQVWWDAELVGSDDFRDVIFDELTLAKAVIVIWSENSVRSKFVRDEAGRADKKNKLITTCVAGFDMESLPMGFGGCHCQPVDEIDQTLKALARLGVLPADQKPAVEQKLQQAEKEAWEKIKTSRNREDFENYIRTYANGLYRAPALIYLRKLDLLNNPNVRRAGRAGYRGLQAFALIFVFALMLMVVVAPFAVIYGNQAPPALGPALLVAALFLTWRLYRWFFSRDKKNST